MRLSSHNRPRRDLRAPHDEQPLQGAGPAGPRRCHHRLAAQSLQEFVISTSHNLCIPPLNQVQGEIFSLAGNPREIDFLPG